MSVAGAEAETEDRSAKNTALAQNFGGVGAGTERGDESVALAGRGGQGCGVVVVGNLIDMQSVKGQVVVEVGTVTWMIPVDAVGTETTEEAEVGQGKIGTANVLNGLKGRVKVS